MNKQLRRLILSIAALALVACAAWLTSSTLEERGEDAFEETQSRTLLSSDAIDRIEIDNAHGEYALRREGVADLPAELIEAARVEALWADLTALELTPVQDAAQESIYGLDAPEARAEIFYEDGSAHTLQIGILEGVSGRYYCRVDDDADIYMADAASVAPLREGADYFLSLRVTPDCRASDPLGAVRDISFVSREQETNY